MRHNPEFDLTVVRRQDNPVLLTRHESTTYLPSHIRPDGDVLKVRVARREPSGRGHSLVERRMNAARLRIDQLWERIQVR